MKIKQGPSRLPKHSRTLPRNGGARADHNCDSGTTQSSEQQRRERGGDLRGAGAFGRDGRLLRACEIQETLGAERDAVFANFKMQVWAGRAPG